MTTIAAGRAALPVTALFAVVLGLGGARALAAESGGAPDREASGRIEFIQSALDAGAPAAERWWSGWLVGYSVATLGQSVGQYGTHDAKTKQDLLVGAATTGAGAAGQLAFPLDAGRLAARLRAMPAGTPDERTAKLAAAEAFLRRSAAQEALGRSWKAHAISGAVNLAAGLVVWKHYDRPARDGLVTFAIGQLVSEAQIFTQPTRAIRNLREYEARSDFTGAAAPRSSGSAWYVSPTPGGLAVGCRF